jgi:hypothetical protein
VVEGKFGRHEALVMRIRTLKWHAIAIQASARTETTRGDAATVVAELDELELALQADRSEGNAAKAETRVDEVTLRLAGMGPLH